MLSRYVRRLVFCIAMTSLTGPLSASVPYLVEFSGTIDPEALQMLQTHSQLVSLNDKLPDTVNALQRRAKADIPHLIQALHSLSYFNADIDLHVDTDTNPVVVRIHVDIGTSFHLESFRVLPASLSGDGYPSASEDILERGQLFLQLDFLSYPKRDARVEWLLEETFEDTADCLVLESITEAFLGLQVGAAALPCDILEAEESLMKWIISQGYPLAEVVKKEVIADQTECSIKVILYVNTGPIAYLAEPNISGNKCVETCFIERKVKWCEGELYSPEAIACTFDSLERTGLFRSVNVELGAELNDEGLLPVDILLAEGRHRTVGFGVSYSTEFGGGVIGEWESRNVRGMGEQLSIQTELLKKFQSGEITYLKPDCIWEGTDWLLGIEGDREITDSFHERSVTATSRLHRRLSPRLQGWIGVAVMYTHSTDTDNNKYFLLGKVPMQLRYSSADNPLDPKHGVAMNLKVTPTAPLFFPSGNYYSTRFDGAMYVPVSPSGSWILAGKLSVASIMGASRKDIPPPERCYAGSPNTLRGYPYLSVSPIDEKNGKPEGGRSLMVISLESRHRISENWGLVGFWEIGNVYKQSSPQFQTKQLQSAGFGGRYYTPVGPVRLDIAFPLDRRHITEIRNGKPRKKCIDDSLQVYFSIGQTY